MASLLQFWSSHASELGTLLAQHVALVLVSTMAAVVAGVPIGIVAARRPRVMSRDSRQSTHSSRRIFTIG